MLQILFVSLLLLFSNSKTLFYKDCSLDSATTCLKQLVLDKLLMSKTKTAACYSYCKRALNLLTSSMKPTKFCSPVPVAMVIAQSTRSMSDSVPVDTAAL